MNQEKKLFVAARPFPNSELEGAGEPPAELSPEKAERFQLPKVNYMPRINSDYYARELGEERALVTFSIEKDGTVGEVYKIDSTSPLFTMLLASALTKMEFEPGLQDGTPVRYLLKMPFGISGYRYDIMQAKHDDYRLETLMQRFD